MFEAIPAELKLYNHWIVWRLETLDNGSKTKVPYDPKTGFKASVTNPLHWSSFFAAEATLTRNPTMSGLGYVLGVDDPFVFIDLDDKDGLKPDGSPKYTDEEKGYIADLQAKVYEAYGPTYAEISPSGTGLHIIGKGSVPTGIRGKAIEVYSSERYMTITGNVHRPFAIVDVQAQNDWLYGVLGGTGRDAPMDSAVDTSEADQEPDNVILARGVAAVNGDRFKTLLDGNWTELYPSQSEADFAFIDMLAFYTHSASQIARIFRASPLGSRQKANRENYVKGMIQRSFDRLPPPLDMAEMNKTLDKQFELARVRGQIRGPERIAEREAEEAAAEVLQVSVPNPYMQPVPGLLGQLAYYMYQVSPRPVAEIALAAAIGLMAGITGRGWNVSRTGLNQYIMLLAGTGRGKESIHDGISRVMAAVAEIGPLGGGCPGAMEFVGPGEIASGQALVKYLDKTSRSFVTVQGEFDITLKTFTGKNINSALLKLKQILLSAYSRSGKNRVLQSMIYSEKEKNTAPVNSPAFSLIGEGTPERFFNLLDEDMVSDGLLPRFTVIYYEGDRPPLSTAYADMPPPIELVKGLAAMCGQALMLNQANQVVDVTQDAEAEDLLDRYGIEIDKIINTAHNDTYEQLWNRAHLKALKLAALIAVGINQTNPIINRQAAQYAIDVVTYDTKRLISKFRSGDIGDSESRQLNDIRKIVRRYLQVKPEDAHKWGATAQMISARVIPKRMLQMRTVNLASFRSDRNGSTGALNRALLGLTEAGVMQKLGSIELERYGARSAVLMALLDPKWIFEGDAGGDDE